MRSRRLALLAIPLVVAVAVVAFVIGASGDEHPFQQSLGTFVKYPVAPLKPGDEACQGPIGLVETTRRVEFNPGTPHVNPGPAIDVTLRATGTRTVLGSGRLPAGFNPRVPQTVTISPVPANARVDVCFRNAGPGETLVFGDLNQGDLTFHNSRVAHPIISTSHPTLNGKPVSGGAIAIVFPSPHQRSVLSLVPNMARHAAVFRPQPLGPWTFWLLGALAVVGAPALLVLALSRSRREDEPEPA